MILLICIIPAVYAEEYTVNEGDVLWKIARDHETTVSKLKEINQLEDVNKIFVGQVLMTEPLSNSEKAVALIESIGTTNTKPAAYINANKYIQHNLGAADGLDGFGALLSILPKGSYGKNVRIFEDGDYVFMHNDYNFFGPKVAFDIFRFEDGLILEHWDNLSEKLMTLNPSGRSQLDGSLLLTDLDKTQTNKELVASFTRDVLMGQAPELVASYINKDMYFQHNTHVADGLDGLSRALEDMARSGNPMVYQKNHMILGQGNFVLSVSEGEFMSKHVAFYDLFRIQDGLIVEHWDVIEEIPAKHLWKNNNGKF